MTCTCSQSTARMGAWVVTRRLARAQEPVHKLAWTLDACLRDRVLDARRLRELAHFFSGFPAAPAPRRKADKRARNGDAESLGVPGRGGAVGDEPNRALGDAGMVLRDPLAMYLLINQARARPAPAPMRRAGGAPEGWPHRCPTLCPASQV